MTKSALKWLWIPIALGIAVFAYIKWDEWIVWPELRQPVLAALKDPESAQFRGLRKPHGALCGEVNSRNSMGGFVGFTRFFSSSSGRYAMEGYSTSSWYGKSKTTEQVVAGLDREIAFMKTRGQKPTDDEMARLEFDALWAEICV